MTVNFKSLALPGIQNLMPYQGGKAIEEVEREFSISGVIKLCSNENPLGLSLVAKSAIMNALDDSARYPDSNGYHLKKKLAERLLVNPSQLTLGNGSNDLLELVAKSFLGSNHSAVFSQHAFLVYKLVVTAQNAKSIVVPAKNWGHDLQAISDAIEDSTRLVFIANPNNPTGTYVGLTELKAFMGGIPGNVLVVVDEAYFEYVDTLEYETALELINEYPNLLVTRTFSKAYGLASLRIGYSVSHSSIAEILNRVRQPFNVNGLALAAAKAILDDHEYLKKSIEVNRNGYQQLVAGINELNLKFIPSVGNFIAIEVPGSVRSLYKRLLNRGVITRIIDVYEMPNHLRVSIGLREENERFLGSLKDLLGSKGM
jgi:histidinol-phosphate aminotransferase|tara:strand:+ start:667 stop:1779 length:1113 start_codon:yes stop_codon:yes gene_type:complete